MPLFQSSVLNKYLKDQDESAVKEAYSTFTKYFHNPTIQENIRESKEEQFQEGFLIELFVKVLGYVINPNPEYNLTTEFKNQSGARKADGAILKERNAIGVIELKSTKTRDLEEVRQQAFDYKANQVHCTYVVTSNFEKLRFYIHNAVDYEEFDLFRLSFDRFRIFYLCLSHQNILKDIPKRIKEESVVKDEQITKQLYADYSVFKRDLFDDLVQRNMDNPLFEGLDEKEIKKTLFQKSQKLLDRFLFIFFAEDRGLLPPNSISKILDQWTNLKELDAYVPLYDRYKKYFGYLNTGFKGKEHDIYAYNGGLFKMDEVLDSMVIDDGLLYRHTFRLTAYDFETEVDVNILGHIFENSLNEIESVNAEIEGMTFEKQTSKRKKDGVFYTPKYITKYIVDNTVGHLCREKKEEMGIVEEDYLKSRKGRKKETLKALDDKLKAYRDWLLQITICDPACGSGAFLNQALNFLIEEHHYIDQLSSALLDLPMIFRDVENSILENNLYGVDLNDESVEIARLSLWLRTAQKGRKLTTLNGNIKCGNSLIDDPEVAGEKAFNWQSEFSEVFKNGGFDVVIGNPPYGADFSEVGKTYIKKHYKISSQGKIDSYKQFIEFGLSITKEKGFLSYITPNTFLYNIQSRGLRKLILRSTKITSGIELRKNIFEDAPDVVPVIFTVRNIAYNQEYKIVVKVAYPKMQYTDIESDRFEIDQILSSLLFKNDLENKFNLRFNNNFLSIKNKIEQYTPLGSFFNLRQGTKPYGDKQNKSAIVLSKYKHDDKWERAINGRNISRFNINWENDFVKRSNELHSCIEKDIVDGEKIYFQRMRKISLYPRVVACYDNSGTHGLYTCSVIYPKKGVNEIDLKYLQALLNSNLINMWYKYYDTDIEIKLISVKQIPIPKISPGDQKKYIERADKLMNLLNDFKKTQDLFLSLIENRYSIKQSQNLKKWDKLEFVGFLDEMKKAKVQFSLPEEAEWMAYFNEQKRKAQALKSEINRIDKEIDQMVYELYGLSEEEIKIVEGLPSMEFNKLEEE